MNAYVELVNGLGHRWAEGMWPIVWQSAVLAGVVFLLARLFRKASAALRFWLWMLVPLRLLVMPLVTAQLPLLPAPSAAPVPAAQSISAPGTLTPALELEAVPAGLAAATTTEAGPLEAVASSAVVWPTLWTWLMAAWLAGVVLFFFRLARGWLNMRQVVSNAEPARTPAVHEAGERASRTVGLRRLPRILVTKEHVSPFVFGVLRPMVVLPAELVERVSAEELFAVLAHEFAHIRRREPVLGWLLAICEALYFFHPAFHLAKRRLIFERECACDDYALALGEARRGVYARALIAAAGVCRTVSRQAAPVAVVAESFHDLKRRLLLLDSDAKRPTRLSLRTLLVLALVSVVALPGIALTARPPTKSVEANDAPRAVTVTVNGKVTDKATGQPIAGARVRGHIAVWRYQGPELFGRSPYAKTKADEQGRYHLTFVTPLTTSGPMRGKDGLCVDASAPGYETKPQYVKPKVTAKKTSYTDVNFALGPGHRLHGKVVDEKGQPLVGALVSVNNGWNGDWHYFGSLGRTETDDKGKFELYCSTDPRTIGSRAWLIISKEGYGTDYVIDILQKEDLATVVITRGGTVTGRVVDGNGKGVANCEVLACQSYMRPVSRSMTDADGRYQLTGIPGEQVYRDFYTWKNRRYMEQWATFTVYARSDLNRKLTQVPRYEIVAQGGKTVAGPDLVVGTEASVSGRLIPSENSFTLQGLLVRLDRGWENMVKVDPEGRFRFPYVTPGGHRLTAYLAHNLRGDRGIGHADITVEAGKALENVEIQLEQLAEVRILISDAEGNPLAGITAGATWAPTGEGFWTEGTKSDATGQAVLHLYPGGPQYVRGFDMARQALIAKNFVEVRPAAGEILDYVRILMIAPAGIRGRAVSKDGQPIAEKVLTYWLDYTDGETVRGRVRTDGEGRFELQRLLPGAATLSMEVEPSGASGWVADPLELESGEAAELGDFVLDKVELGDQAPELALEPPSTVSLAQLRGRRVVLAFVSIYSRPCVRLLDELKALQEEHGADKLAVIAVHDPTATAQEVAAFRDRNGIAFPVLPVSAEGGEGLQCEPFRTYGVKALPAVVLIDRQGKVVSRGDGAGLSERLAKFLEN